MHACDARGPMPVTAAGLRAALFSVSLLLSLLLFIFSQPDVPSLVAKYTAWTFPSSVIRHFVGYLGRLPTELPIQPTCVLRKAQVL